MSSLWGEGDEAQLLESYLRLILHSRKQSLWRWLGEGIRNWGLWRRKERAPAGAAWQELASDSLWAQSVARLAMWA